MVVVVRLGSSLLLRSASKGYCSRKVSTHLSTFQSYHRFYYNTTTTTTTSPTNKSSSFKLLLQQQQQQQQLQKKEPSNNQLLYSARRKKGIMSYSSSSSSSYSSSTTSTPFSAWRVIEEEQIINNENETKKKKYTYQGSEQTLIVEKDLIKKQQSSSPEDDDDDDDDTVLIQVLYSALNYKDALSAIGNKGVTKQYPHIPGIDAAGIIVQVDTTTTNENNENENDSSSLFQYQPGTSVLVTGYDLGMNTNGGFGEYIRVPKKWCITPSPFLETATTTTPDADAAVAVAARTAMIYGTAGLTAGLCVQKLLNCGHAQPSDGPIAITGASGAVGSVAVELLSQLGFEVVAISGKSTSPTKDWLYELGATSVVGRDVLEQRQQRPLLKPKFAHGIDTVGGSPLVELLKQIQPGGSVSCCGLVAGTELTNLTIIPFILRGIQLLGVDSVDIPLQDKVEVWKKLATTWNCPIIEESAQEIGRYQLNEYLMKFLNGTSHGKIILNHNIVKDDATTPTTFSKL